MVNVTDNIFKNKSVVVGIIVSNKSLTLEYGLCDGLSASPYDKKIILTENCQN